MLSFYFLELANGDYYNNVEIRLTLFFWSGDSSNLVP